LVKEGRFRQDLFFRLASIPVDIPSLRSRPEDIRILAIRFASEFAKSLTPEAITRLQVGAWPGNVRELRHAIERASAGLGQGEGVIHSSDFEFLSEARFRGEAAESDFPGVRSLKEMEKIMILRALKHANGNRTDAARVLGIARSTLFEMMKRHEILGPRTRDFWETHLIGEIS
jgi:DNA-binding NtrC family response regulator